MFFLTFNFNLVIEIEMPNTYYPLTIILNLMGHHFLGNCTFFNHMGYNLIADCTFLPITLTPLKIEIEVVFGSDRSPRSHFVRARSPPSAY